MSLQVVLPFPFICTDFEVEGGIIDYLQVVYCLSTIGTNPSIHFMVALTLWLVEEFAT